MKYNQLGKTDLSVSKLGFGAGHIGSYSMTENEVGTLLGRAVDRGINFIDTAKGYGLSEQRIGYHLSWRRKDFVLTTKVGYGIPGTDDWSYDSILLGVEDSLRKCQTDYLDVVLLHSCPKEIFQRERIRHALAEVVRSGKVRYVGYSGENEDLEAAVEMDDFDVIECSFNICDQYTAKKILPKALDKGLGIIAKRPLANAFWRFNENPVGEYCEVYWNRWQAMALDIKQELGLSLSVEELVIQFIASFPNINTGIIGTSKIAHLEKNVLAFRNENLSNEIMNKIMDRFQAVGKDWKGEL